MNWENGDGWLGRKFKKLIHNIIFHNELYFSCYNVFMVSMIQSAKSNDL